MSSDGSHSGDHGNGHPGSPPAIPAPGLHLLADLALNFDWGAPPNAHTGVPSAPSVPTAAPTPMDLGRPPSLGAHGMAPFGRAASSPFPSFDAPPAPSPSPHAPPAFPSLAPAATPQHGPASLSPPSDLFAAPIPVPSPGPGSHPIGFQLLSATRDTRTTSVSAMQPPSVPTRKRANTAGPPRPVGIRKTESRRSARVRGRERRRFEAMTQTTGTVPPGHSSNDLSPWFALPLEPGNDLRGYTSSEARSRIDQAIASSSETFGALEQSPIPPPALNLRNTAQSTGQSSAYVSNRSDQDAFMSGQVFAYTENVGLDVSGTRAPGDTPQPSSPHPDDTGSAMPNTRYERSHSEAFRFTGQPGHTVWAPTQANQVVDAHHERFVASRPGAFMVQHHTPEATSTYSAAPTDSGQWEVRHSSYRRRAASADAPPAAPPPSPTAAPSPVPSPAPMSPPPSPGPGTGHTGTGK